ncbi:LapA family protein [Aliiroseovarius subalbicans]|uniref:lipopolysaccharide assembly protein LapA domain-containing protein n=1 Tax=Aliiroseovarius subalbicans TaxID=2925840 RepID=UPI001F5916F1|nr:LapA family protein [Aliiroseovarius subalbicans]MCI2400295.1 LapA family protein [Aliiroseovarius subalbicans]
MRYFRYAFLAVLAVCLITVALANRSMVSLHLLPEELSGFLGFSWTVSLPLFIVIFLGIIAGILIGFVWEWFREHKIRAEGVQAKREKDRLAKEVEALKRPAADAPGDDVLALLE